MWTGGETIAVSATGGEVPAFNASVAAPSPFTVSLPSCASSECSIDIDRTSPLVFEWTSGPVGDVVVTLGVYGWRYLDEQPFMTRIRIAQLDCHYPNDVGGATLEPQVLGLLPPVTVTSEPPFDDAFLTVSRRTATSLTQEAGIIKFEVQWVARRGPATLF